MPNKSWHWTYWYTLRPKTITIIIFQLCRFLYQSTTTGCDNGRCDVTCLSLWWQHLFNMCCWLCNGTIWLCNGKIWLMHDRRLQVKHWPEIRGGEILQRRTEYLKRMTRKQCSNMIKISTRMLPVKSNFGDRYENKMCRLCQEEEETQKHKDTY